MQLLRVGIAFVAMWMVTGCGVQLTPEMIEALAKDNASFCARAGARGGAGMLAVTPVPIPSGGYGSAEWQFCRSNHERAKVTLAPDGSITIEHQ